MDRKTALRALRPTLTPEELEHLSRLLSSEAKRRALVEGRSISEECDRHNAKFSEVATLLLPAVVSLKQKFQS